MQNIVRWLATGSLSFLSVFGGVCMAASTPARPVPVKPSPSDILVRVNDVDITRAQLDRHLDMMVVLLKNNKKNVTEEQVAKFKKKNLKPFSDNLFLRTVIDTCLSHSNIVEQTAVRADTEKEYLRKFGKRKQSFKELKKIVADAGFEKEFSTEFERDIRLETFVRTVYSNEYYITQKKVDEVRKNMEAYNARATMTNTATMAQANALLKRIKAGEDFAKLADTYSADYEKKPGGDLGDCDDSDFSDEPHIWRMLSKMKAGTVSDVIETEDGYAIYKVIRKNTAEQSVTTEASLTLARIYFRRAYIFPEQSNEELWADVEKETRAKLFSDVYKKFRAQSKVTYPNGHIKAR